ncbi:NUDIX domain-containing protein [Chondromyces apiculatus]|uniref:NUDIX hydrolase n=1 Tax=Chondromyces apiculatus DSM 436 TaxID=1192034 RepID=A0A017TFZ4_9BACT|nr:NUDIX hydrolase [Chondromyces apiculatus]EYF07847.1 NUDIX hydrolase [Chondromyces apiculatus DSM 436]
MSAHAESQSYPKPSLTADVVVIAPEVGVGGSGQGLQVLLIRRGKDPYQGSWALPGGFCDPGESVEQAAARELEEETGLRGVRLEQVYTFSEPGRDPRGWVVSVAHLALIPPRRLNEARAGDDAHEARWWPIRPLADLGYRLESETELAGRLAFDHDEVLRKALARLARDVDLFASDLLDERFTEADLARMRDLIEALGGGAP